MLCPLRAVYVHTFTGRTTRTRARPERGCGPEHECDGRDWPVHRDSAGDSVDGRTAVPAGMGGGSGAFYSGWARLGGTRRGHAARRRNVRVSPGNLRAGARRAPDVLSLYLADTHSGAAGRGLGRNRVFAIPHLSRSLEKVRAESDFGVAGSIVDRPSVPQNFGGRPDLEISLDRRRGHDGVDDLGRCDAFLGAHGVRFSSRRMELVLAVFRGAGLG